MLPAARENDAPIDQAARAGATSRAPIEPQKQSFLRVVSHELRTPLNSILGFSEILASELYGPLGAPQYLQYAEIIKASGEKLLKLVNQVVEIARLQTGEVQFAVHPELLGPILGAAVTGLDDALAARRLHLALEPCGELEAQVDGRALRAVLAQLLQNALTFSPDEGRIRVSAGHAGDDVVVTVSNDGEGVDASDIARILRPFEQGENALTRQGEGVGLGLAICDLTCQGMGARLEVTSDRGQGFSATIRMPRA